MNGEERKEDEGQQSRLGPLARALDGWRGVGVVPEFAATKGQGEKKRAPGCLVVTMGRGRRQVSSAGLGEKRRSVSRAMRLAPVMCG